MSNGNKVFTKWFFQDKRTGKIVTNHKFTMVWFSLLSEEPVTFETREHARKFKLPEWKIVKGSVKFVW